MKTASFKATSGNRRKAMALVLVIMTVALLSMLIVAIFSVTRTEYKATQNFVAGRSAKQLGDNAVSIVQAQIQSGQNAVAGSSNTQGERVFHATQPGMVRVYRGDGTFLRAHKLYSSSQMVIDSAGSEAVVFDSTHQIPTDWKSQAARFVDLNEPVLRAGSGAQAAVFFPIIDPRAAYNSLGSQTPTAGSPTTQVEGFSYSKETATGAGSKISYNEVVLPTEVSDANQLRLPMPVEWIYVLQDGTLGALNASNEFVSANSQVQPSATNPIIGRIAFWTDDESCKVNINTASEPTYMGTPFFYHDRDRRWAHFPASTGEYQRYPGHPATVALSAILAPGYLLDPWMPDNGLSRQDIINLKEAIYGLMPKIATGGSLAGTVPYINDAFSSANNETQALSSLIDVTTARKERLYASVDELLFTDNEFISATGRKAATISFSGGGSTRNLLDHDVIERSRFFLTANSRSPEFSIYGLPRICMWPVADESLGSSFRTSFDNMIALCSTISGGRSGAGVSNSYVFRRARAHSQTYDLPNTGSGSLGRNSKLLDYLSAQMSNLTWPRSNLGTSTNYSQKYGQDNVNQLAVQFFDYVRSTNLYDGVLAREHNVASAFSNIDDPNTYPSGTNLYNIRDQFASNRRTYTEQRISRPASALIDLSTNRTDEAGALPGHGQVTPAVWNKDGQQYRGFGRMFTLSEIGFNFICTADGKNDDNSFNLQGNISGGGTAIRYKPQQSTNRGSAPLTATVGESYPYVHPDVMKANDGSYWYSNYPPYPSTNPLQYGTVALKALGSDHARAPWRHPGYNPANWNMTLAPATPLTATQKRIQAVLLMEAFCPSLGWTKIHPEYTIVVDGDYIGQIQLNNQRLFQTAGPIAVKSAGNLFEASGQNPVGGHASPSGMVGNRGGRPVSSGGVLMPSDQNYVTGNTSGHNALTNYGITSDFITVERGGGLQLRVPSGDLKIDIYDTHMWESAQPIQTIRVRFADAFGAAATLPMPYLPGGFDNNNPPVRQPIVDMGFWTTTNTNGTQIYTRARQAPKYWCYNYQGCVMRLNGNVNQTYYTDDASSGALFNNVIPDTSDSGLKQSVRGRLDTNTGAVFGVVGTAQTVSTLPDAVSDVIRTVVPVSCDYRMIAARYNVTANMWQPHPSWAANTSPTTTLRQAHSFTGSGGNLEAGARLAVTPGNTDPKPYVDQSLQLVAGVPYNTNGQTGVDIVNTDGNYNSRQPDLPGSSDFAKAANSFGDFDNGIASARDGAYINKPDEGNFYAGIETDRTPGTRYYRSGYFYNSWKQSDDWRSGIYNSPNRLISSPVMFGSLPTGVWATAGAVPVSATSGTSLSNIFRPWQTLLFRPHAISVSTSGVGTKDTHPGEYSPRDHYLLDMFFMPVVEPYAISEPLSVAGRINLNYQIMPFTNIRRATALHALMKGEFMTAIPNADVTRAKSFKGFNNNQWDLFYNDANDQKFWHRPIDVVDTLRQFDERFNNDSSLPQASRGLFRAASQICEIHLIPATRSGPNIFNVSKPTNAATRKTQMDAFWRSHSGTGDNVRERPYSNLYSRITTRSNTFRVYIRSQVIRKARSVAANQVDATKDLVVSEYRGSSLIERYIDPSDSTIPDYGNAGTSALGLPRLETFYRFRTLESKRFSP